MAMLCDDVLLEIFDYLSVEELISARYVCKRWNNVACSDVLWKKFIPKWPGFVPPSKPTALQTVKEMWEKSEKIGKERWYPNPLPELADYGDFLLKRYLQFANVPDGKAPHDWRIFRQDFCMGSKRRFICLYIRLNPCYDITTKGNDTNDKQMIDLVYEMYQRLVAEKGFDVGVIGYSIPALMSTRDLPDAFDTVDVMKSSRFQTHRQATDELLVAKRERLIVKKDDSGSFIVRSSNYGLIEQLKALFADKSQHFIKYYWRDKWKGTGHVDHYTLIVSDAAAFYHC